MGRGFGDRQLRLGFLERAVAEAGRGVGKDKSRSFVKLHTRLSLLHSSHWLSKGQMIFILDSLILQRNSSAARNCKRRHWWGHGDSRQHLFAEDDHSVGFR